MATNELKQVAEHVERARRHGTPRQLRLQLNTTGQFWWAGWVVTKDDNVEHSCSGITAEAAVRGLVRILDDEWRAQQAKAVRS